MSVQFSSHKTGCCSHSRQFAFKNLAGNVSYSGTGIVACSSLKVSFSSSLMATYLCTHSVSNPFSPVRLQGASKQCELLRSNNSCFQQFEYFIGSCCRGNLERVGGGPQRIQEKFSVEILIVQRSQCWIKNIDFNLLCSALFNTFKNALGQHFEPRFKIHL